VSDDVSVVEGDDEETEQWHRRFAIDLFNRSWDLLEQTDRSPDDDAEMLAAAFGSSPEDPQAHGIGMLRRLRSRPRAPVVIALAEEGNELTAVRALQLITNEGPAAARFPRDQHVPRCRRQALSTKVFERLSTRLAGRARRGVLA